MVVALLNPQDCLKHPYSPHTPFPNMKVKKPPPNPKPVHDRPKNAHHNSRRKRSPFNPRNGSPPQRTSSTSTSVASRSEPSKLVMGQVKILKRGEKLTEVSPDRESDPPPKKENRQAPDLGSPIRRSHEPESYGIDDFYAGLPFGESPPPSSLPLPAILIRKGVKTLENDATSVLKQILRLDLL